MSARRGERGLSLAEVLVAMTVLVIAGTVAMFLYDAARRSFKKGENATEQQQAVRIGFDMLSTDVRLANFNANPAGESDDVDEGIEAAYDTAIVLRADYDAEQPEATTPEPALAGAARRAVAVGNDEIVAYVLAKPDVQNPDTLSFEADVKDSPRDGVVETVSIPNVALVQDDPPYTLYRITLNDPGTWGSGNFLTRTTVLDNVRSLRFRYAGAGGALSAAGGADTPSARRMRTAIQHVDIELEGLTRDPDLSWQDASDSNPATRSFRKFTLRGTITPRNLGRKGLVDPGWDTTPPGKPTGPGGGDLTLVPGHCKGLYVLWDRNPLADGVVAYSVNWTTPGQPAGHRITASNGAYVDGLENGLPYLVTVAAQDAAGNWSPPSDGVSAITTDVNHPGAPSGVSASTDLADGIHLTWNPVTQNTTSDPSADPARPMIRDLEGYELWRGVTDNYQKTDPGVLKLADERMLGPQASPSYVDSDVVPCRDYYYQVVAVDYCNKTNETGVHTHGFRTTSAPPAAPTGLKAVFSAPDTVRLVWEPVTRDVSGNPLLADSFLVARCVGPLSSGLNCSDYAPLGTVQGETSFIDTPTPPLAPDQAVYYRVQAKTECPSQSAWSAAATPPPCIFEGQVSIVKPDRNLVASPVRVEVQVLGSAASHNKAILEFRNEADLSLYPVELFGSGPWTYNWTPPVLGKYLIKATVAKDAAATCTSFATTRVTVRP